ncbi:MAG: hypothetical protein KDN22_24150 [Verrucomicrobiae bacterium]|nr:hypothetical protein [Verrucomicrobiae bacterium]
MVKFEVRPLQEGGQVVRSSSTKPGAVTEAEEWSMARHQAETTLLEFLVTPELTRRSLLIYHRDRYGRDLRVRSAEILPVKSPTLIFLRSWRREIGHRTEIASAFLVRSKSYRAPIEVEVGVSVGHSRVDTGMINWPMYWQRATSELETFMSKPTGVVNSYLNCYVSVVRNCSLDFPNDDWETVLLSGSKPCKFQPVRVERKSHAGEAIRHLDPGKLSNLKVELKWALLDQSRVPELIIGRVLAQNW